MFDKLPKSTLLLFWERIVIFVVVYSLCHQRGKGEIAHAQGNDLIRLDL